MSKELSINNKKDYKDFILYLESHSTLKFLISCFFYHPNEPLKEEDILNETDFAYYRFQLLHFIMDLKKKRTLKFGSHMTLFIEHKILIWWQIQEMLRIEKGGLQQIKEELETYNPLIPKKNHLVVTWMLEFLETKERKEILQKLEGISHHLHLQIKTKHKKNHEEHLFNVSFHECPYYLGGKIPDKNEPAHSVYFMEAFLPPLEDFIIENVYFLCTHKMLEENIMVSSEYWNKIGI